MRISKGRFMEDWEIDEAVKKLRTQGWSVVSDACISEELNLEMIQEKLGITVSFRVVDGGVQGYKTLRTY